MMHIFNDSLSIYSRTSAAQQAWYHANWFQLKVVPVSQDIYQLNSRDSSSTYRTSAVRDFVLLFSFSIFSDRRSLKIENENNRMNI